MPRPRVLKQSKVVPLVFEAELYERLRDLARSRGLSVSAYVRMLVERELGLARQQAQAEGELVSAAEDDPLDPLVEVDVEEFEQQLQRLEGEVAELERAVEQAVKSGHGYGYFSGSQLGELNQLAWRLTERWQSLRRWYYRLKRDLPARRAYTLSGRMASLKKRLNTLLERTRNRRW
jgi:hypothetical protein